MKAWIYRNRIMLSFPALVLLTVLIAELADYLRHGGMNEFAHECVVREGGQGRNICEQKINFAVCVRGQQRKSEVPCYQIGAVAPGTTAPIAKEPDGVQTVFLACRDPYRPTRAPRQESNLRVGYACARSTTGLRLTQ